MNSYPPELLLQLAPVMFVGGLDIQRSAAPSSSPPPSARASSPPLAPTTPKRVHSDPFTLLTHRLREALIQHRKPTIWAPEAVRKSKTFQVVLVDKTVQFPPRKIPPSSDLRTSQAPHSPLSPLTPSSPLYPDGLIAPIWIRKHTALVPSVFVLFIRLYEHPASTVAPRSPLEPDSPEVQRERDNREKEERWMDTELAKEISERKKSTNERGMKLTVVLIASRRMLDDPALDTRLTFIRRTSGLDSRAALFVLSPVSQTELSEFIKSLMQALYDPAVEYYASHSKRVRRKRNRHAQSTQYPIALGANASAIPTPLRPEGWTIRYEYKMACFAEFRGEEEVALKHYQDAYSTLMLMICSPAILPPRTKRWAEAKVLADCINVKICKLYLYNSEHALALSQLNQHLRRFSELSSRVWGIGEDTFEYWSWLARQYRVFAELTEQGTHAALTIPEHLPSPTPTQPQQEIDALRALGLNPSTALMHPGFYYYVAAECTERRRERFLDAVENETHTVQAPGFSNEKKVDHLASILELYTKSYELFKKYTFTAAAPSSPPNQLQGRFTLWIANRIGQTYYSYGKYDMAIKFFERIAKTYRREQWSTMLGPLLRKWYACAQQLGDVELSIKLLVELLISGQDSSPEEDIAEDLVAILKSTVPSSNEPLVVDLTDSEPLLDSSVVFWSSEGHIGEQIPFQITLSAPANSTPSSLPVSELRIYRSDDATPLVVKHVSSEFSGEDTAELVNVGNLRVPSPGDKPTTACLRWKRDHILVLSGCMTSELSQALQFEKAVIVISEGSWVVELPFKLDGSRKKSSRCPRWLTSVNPSKSIPIRRDKAHIATFKHRPLHVHVSFAHHPPAYLDEQYPIVINVTNNDERQLDVSVDVLLQPGDDDSVNHIALDEQQSTSLIKGVLFGVLHPGVTACKTLRLSSAGAAGERMLDISVQSRSVTSPERVESPSSPASPVSPAESGEMLQTLIIPTVAPFKVTHDVSYRRQVGSLPYVSDLSAYDPAYWDNGIGGCAGISTVIECSECPGATSLTIEKIALSIEKSDSSRLTGSSVEDEEFPLDVDSGDQLSLITEFDLAPPEDFFANGDAALPKPGQYLITWKRTNRGNEALTTSYIDLPSLQPPSDNLIALLHVPPLGYLHQPFPLELVIRNSHPARSALPMVSIELDQSESFVIAGIRNAHLPLLVPGAEEKIVWHLIPLECGPAVPLPRIRVTDMRRGAENKDGAIVEGDAAVDDVRVVDIRWDRRGSDSSSAGEDGKVGLGDRRFTMLISPS